MLLKTYNGPRLRTANDDDGVVRPAVVYKALQWYMKHNPWFAENVTMDYDALSGLAVSLELEYVRYLR
jgi:hypothetical protein